MPLMHWLTNGWRRIVGWFRGDVRLVDIHGDEPPHTIGPRRLIRMIDEGEPWAAVMNCPCGCGDVIELSLSPASKTYWTLSMDGHRPTLHPSVWRDTGCRSHFWLQCGQVRWVP